MSKQSKQNNLESMSAESSRGQAAEAIAAPESNDAEVRERAYSYWQQRGCPVGSPDEDWLRAERELKDRSVPSATQ